MPDPSTVLVEVVLDELVTAVAGSVDLVVVVVEGGLSYGAVGLLWVEDEQLRGACLLGAAEAGEV